MMMMMIVRMSSVVSGPCTSDDLKTADRRGVLSIYPSAQELGDLHASYGVQVPTNMVRQPFHSPQHYIETQYKLLRADCYMNLSKSVNELRRGLKHDDRDTHVYDVLGLTGLARVDRSNHGLCRVVSFKARSAVRWERTDRLSEGNLLCITTDNFDATVIYATVAYRDVDALNRGEIVLQIEMRDAERIQQALLHKQPVIMAENDAFFTMYRPVLTALSRMTADRLSESIARALWRLDDPAPVDPARPDLARYIVQRMEATGRITYHPQQRAAIVHALAYPLTVIQVRAGAWLLVDVTRCDVAVCLSVGVSVRELLIWWGGAGLSRDRPDVASRSPVAKLHRRLCSTASTSGWTPPKQTHQ